MTEQNQNRLMEALRCLREDAASKAAPETLESALLQAFRQQRHSEPAKPRRVMWAAAAIAASLTAAVAWRVSNPVQVNVELAPKVEKVAAAPSPAPEVSVQPAVTKTVRPKRRAPVKQYASAPKPEPAPRPEPFIQIPYAPAFTPYEEAQVVRVSMPGSSVRQLGLPAAADRVQADLLVGNDGLARAIRLVSSSGLNSYR